jgi:hypothetical protein
MLSCESLLTFGAKAGMFPAPVVIFAMASAILLCIVSLLQDVIGPRLRFSLAQLLFVTGLFAAMFGAALKIWRLL